jgi:hypothetical protein
MLREGRKNKWSGNTMKPGALVNLHKTRWIGLTQTRAEWSSKPLLEVQYEVEIGSYFPWDAIFSEKDEIKRFETLSFWHPSYQEELRHLELIGSLRKTELFLKLKEIVDSHKQEIIDAFVKYVGMIIKEGDMSFEQWKFYVTEHKNSASPYEGKHWNDILQNDSELKKTWTEMNKWLIQFQKQLPQILSIRRPLIKVEAVYPALRARPSETELTHKDNDRIILKCKKIRDRKAGGVKGLSQLEYPIFKRSTKKKIYQECFYNLIEKISGCKLIPITTYGASFYSQVFDTDINCYDLRNAEKLVGILLDFLPVNVDLGHPEYPEEDAGEMYSGIGPTRPMAEIVVGVLTKLLKILGYAIDILFLGGDNFGFKLFIDCISDGFDLVFTNEDTILGANPKLKRFYPLSLVTDSVKNRQNIPTKWSALIWTQRFQFELRPLQVIVDNDLYKPGSCEKKIKWVVESGKLTEQEIYSKESLNTAISENEDLKEKFYDMFITELQYLKNFIPTHNNQNQSTDAHLTPIRRN